MGILVIEMLMYFSANILPDIVYAVHQVARFSHNPKNNHSLALKCILHYPKKLRIKALIQILENYLGHQIPEIPCQSNQDLCIS